MRSLGYVEGLFIYTTVHANKLPSQACSSISEFFCFAGLMEIFSPATWGPALSAICGEGKGLKEIDIHVSIIVSGLMRYASCKHKQKEERRYEMNDSGCFTAKNIMGSPDADTF